MSSLYDYARGQFASGQIDWVNDSIKIVIVDSADYTVDLANDGVLSDVPAAARVYTATMTGKAISGDGACDADDTFMTLTTGDSAEAAVVYKFTGVEATSTLIAYLDDANGFPIVPSNNNIAIIWDNGVNKIFRL